MSLIYSDLTSSGMLCKLSPVGQWSEEEIYRHFGQPKIEPVIAIHRSWLYSLFKSQADNNPTLDGNSRRFKNFKRIDDKIRASLPTSDQSWHHDR